MKTFLHVGCGHARKEHTTPGFRKAVWRELRLDIDPAVQPDVIGSMVDMHEVASGSVHAVYSSHSIEHLYAHEVPVALGEFLRVLGPEGFAVITCPDLQAICALVAQDKLTDVAYVSPAGPVAPIDMLYGLRAMLAHGHLYMAHRCGFTPRVLVDALLSAGFQQVLVRVDPAPYYALWAVASKAPCDEDAIRELANEHFPAV